MRYTTTARQTLQKLMDGLSLGIGTSSMFSLDHLSGTGFLDTVSLHYNGFLACS
jgi:hypothetical protein